MSKHHCMKKENKTFQIRFPDQLKSTILSQRHFVIYQFSVLAKCYSQKKLLSQSKFRSIYERSKLTKKNRCINACFLTTAVDADVLTVLFLYKITQSNEKQCLKYLLRKRHCLRFVLARANVIYSNTAPEKCITVQLGRTKSTHCVVLPKKKESLNQSMIFNFS